jgi:hypothetical protein
MCVILIADKKKLSKEMIEAAMDANPDGNGVAWVERGKVRWEKGLVRREALALIKTLKPPYVFHARIATVGGKSAALTHPFAIGPRADQIRLSGTNKTGVIFHNGTWTDWEDYYETTPDGAWSDSRAMADLVNVHGPEALEVVDAMQRIVMLTPKGMDVRGPGWSEVAPGVRASNTWFMRHYGDKLIDWARGLNTPSLRDQRGNPILQSNAAYELAKRQLAKQ